MRRLVVAVVTALALAPLAAPDAQANTSLLAYKDPGADRRLTR